MDDDKLLAYFERIGYFGTPSPSLQTLKDIQKLHVTAIPFENIGIFTDVPKSVDFNTIFKLIVEDKKGGWCFEQNTLLYQVLLYLGFTVTRQLARLRLDIPEDLETPLTHLVLKVTLPEDDYLVDVAFGAGSPTDPLKIQDKLIQITDLDYRRLLSAPDGSFLHEIAYFNNPDVFKPIYLVTNRPVLDADVAMSSWFCETFPTTRMVNYLVVSMPKRDHRVSIENRNFAKRYADGTCEKKEITDLNHLKVVLKEEFGVEHELSETAAFNRIFKFQ